MLYFLPVMYVDLVLTNCLVLDGIYALSIAHIDSTPSLKMFPTLCLKQFQSSCSRKIVEQFLFPRLNLPCCWSGDVLDIKPEGGVLSSSTLPIFRDASRLWRLPCPPVCLLGHSFTPPCPGQYSHRCFRRWVKNIGPCQSGLAIPLLSKQLSCNMFSATPIIAL